MHASACCLEKSEACLRPRPDDKNQAAVFTLDADVVRSTALKSNCKLVILVQFHIQQHGKHPLVHQMSNSMQIVPCKCTVYSFSTKTYSVQLFEGI